jgi:hypothetical protein
MKRALLFTAILAGSMALVNATNDITPTRYIFAEQPVGQYKIDATNAGANPPAGWTTPIDNYDNGYLVFAGGPAVFTGLDAPQPAAIQEGLNIVDMGGDVGKVLVLRGKSSAYNVGAPMGDGYAGAWFNMNFYADKATTPTIRQFIDAGYSTEEATNKAKVRIRMVFSIAENDINITGSLLGKFYTSNSQNNTSPTDFNTHSPFPSDAFQTTDEYGDPIPNDDGEAYYDPTKWMLYEFDFTVPEVTGLPTRLKIEITPAVGNGTLLIKEIKFTKEPEGEPVTRQMLTLTPEITGLNFVRSITSELHIGLQGNTIQLLNVTEGKQVTVYNSTGQQLLEFTTTSASESFELEKGFYIIRSGNKSTKVSI